MRELAVLVIEDDDNTIAILRTAFKMLTIQTYWAHTAHEGLRLVSDVQPDLILVDLLLPHGLKGWDAIRILKNTPETRAIPIVAMTAGSIELLDHARHAGSNAILRKPFQFRDIQRLADQYMLGSARKSG